MGKSPCCSKLGLNRGPWSTKEDMLLTTYIQAHGEGHWRSLPKKAGLLRCGKSCRLRWMNYLRPGIKRGNITIDEEDLIIRLHGLLGNRWSLIAGRLPGRTDNEIKNYWNTHLVKRLRNSGVVKPKTPRNKAATKKIDKEEEQSNQKKKHDNDVDNTSNSNIINEESNNVAAAKIKVYAPKPFRVVPGFSRSSSFDSLMCSSSSGEEAIKVEDPDFAWSPVMDFGAGNILVGEGDRDDDDRFLVDSCDFLFQDDSAPTFGDFPDHVYDEYLHELRFGQFS